MIDRPQTTEISPTELPDELREFVGELEKIKPGNWSIEGNVEMPQSCEADKTTKSTKLA